MVPTRELFLRRRHAYLLAISAVVVRRCASIGAPYPLLPCFLSPATKLETLIASCEMFHTRIAYKYQLNVLCTRRAQRTTPNQNQKLDHLFIHNVFHISRPYELMARQFSFLAQGHFNQLVLTPIIHRCQTLLGLGLFQAHTPAPAGAKHVICTALHDGGCVV